MMKSTLGERWPPAKLQEASIWELLFPFRLGIGDMWDGVVTLSQTERNLSTIANVDARDFSDLAFWLIVQIGPIHLM